MRKFAIVVLLALAVPATAQEMVKALSEDGLEKTISYDDVDIESDVETDVSGYYVVDYTFTDTEFDTGTGSAKLYVVVEEGKGAAQ